MAQFPARSERRRTSRFDKVFPVWLSLDCGKYRGIARNISAGGMFIETRDPAPLGGKVAVVFADQDTGVELQASAEVRYQCSIEYGGPTGPLALRGMGVRFVGFQAGAEPAILAAAGARPH
jgi:hypothetical protein